MFCYLRLVPFTENFKNAFMTKGIPFLKLIMTESVLFKMKVTVDVSTKFLSCEEN